MKLLNGIIRTTTSEGYSSKLYVNSYLKKNHTELKEDVLLLKRIFFTKFPEGVIILKQIRDIYLCEENLALQEPTLLTLIFEL